MGVKAKSISTQRRPAPEPGAQGGIARLFEMTSDLLATVSPSGRITLVNPAWREVLGWSESELCEHAVADLVHPDDAEEVLAPIRAGASGPAEVRNRNVRFLHRDGSWHWLLWSARRDAETWYAAARDINERLVLERQALHDPLTHLPNRMLFMDRARQALARLHRSPGVLAMLFIDLDRFKAVNDNLGHDAGDRLLVSVSERLAELMRDSDTVARLGGDEFVILAEELDGDSEATALAGRVIDALEHPFALGCAEVAILASVGISIARDPDADPEAMLREADLAMYRAKAAGGRRLEIFDERLREQVSANVELERMLRGAISRQELTLAYQPILPLAGGQAVGAEALLRWNPSRDDWAAAGEMLPGAFLPSAEGSDLVVQIGNWVLHTACAQAETWRRAGISIPISINVSARELTELDLAERVREELTYCRLPGHALCLEVSEDVVMKDPERSRAALSDVRRLGVSIALDRVGSGQHSPGLPRNLPLDVVKLDRMLVGSFARDRERRAMFAAAIALAKEAGLKAVAVGIESTRQLALARELDCTVGQGFLLQGPVAPERLRLRDGAGSVTSAPWRPLVRLGGSNRR